jgi:DNA-binding NarL/FixJ family response regulator
MRAGERPSHVTAFILDAHPVVRDVIRLACESHSRIRVLGDSGDGSEALDACRRLRPDVLVVDPELPGSTGTDVIENVRNEAPETRVLVVSAKTDGESVIRTLAPNVHGYLPKTALADTVAAAVLAVGSGGTAFSEDLDRAAMETLSEIVRRARRAGSVRSVLTAREREVLGLIARSFTNRQIASRLGISERTVESHISKLYRKLEVKTRSQAVARALSLDLVDQAEGAESEGPVSASGGSPHGNKT